jgi:hypothetical protein
VKVNRLGMTIILVACGSIAILALSSGQPLDRFGGLFVFLAGVAGLGWLCLRGAARREVRTRAWLGRPTSRAVPKWRLGLSALLLLLGLIVVVTGPRRISGYVFCGSGVAGLLGFNVFRGGPLDKRRPLR